MHIYASTWSGDAYSDQQLTPNFGALSWNFLCADMFPCEDSKTVSVCPYPEKINHPSFFNISPTVIIDTSMERYSQLLPTAWKAKNLIFFNFKKRSKLNFDLCPSVRTSRNHLSFVNISSTAVVNTSMERYSQVLQHGIPKIGFSFQRRSKLNFDLCWNHLSFINISTTFVIDASMERNMHMSVPYSFQFVIITPQWWSECPTPSIILVWFQFRFWYVLLNFLGYLQFYFSIIIDVHSCV